jgi:peptidyl-Lys metalloendopeptidase
MIWICPAYWSAPDTGTDSKAGTLVHEASHWEIDGGTSDYVYGQSDSEKLARNDPSEAIMNAENYEYFAENDPPE